MPFELDHVFICVQSPRAHVQRLVDAGFCEGSGNVHPGQGTANARFFFDNAFVELLWAVDESELAADVVRPTCLSERMRWRETGACPFGVAFRGELDAPPLWRYDAPFFPPGKDIPCWSRPGVASDPFLFAFDGVRPDIQAREPLGHLPPGGDRYEITAVDILCPSPPPLPEPWRIDSGPGREYALGPVLIREARTHWIKLVLRSSAGPLHVSFGPDLPLDIVG